MGTSQPEGPLEDWIGLQIRVAQERGDFDNLPGAGKPIPDLDRPWTAEEWLARWAKREGADVSLALPPSLRLRKERDELPERIAGQRTEQAVRDLVEDFNTRLRQAYLRPQEGPPLTTARVDADEAVQRWRATQPAQVPAVPQPAKTGASPRSRWWRSRWGSAKDRPVGS